MPTEQQKSDFRNFLISVATSRNLPKGMSAPEFLREVIERTRVNFPRGKFRDIPDQTSIGSFQHKLKGRSPFDVRELYTLFLWILDLWGISEQESGVISLIDFLSDQVRMEDRLDFYVPQRNEALLRQLRKGIFPLATSPQLEGPDLDRVLTLTKDLVTAPRNMSPFIIHYESQGQIGELDMEFFPRIIFFRSYSLKIEGYGCPVGDSPTYPPLPHVDPLRAFFGKDYRKSYRLNLIATHGGDEREIKWAENGWSIWSCVTS